MKNLRNQIKLSNLNFGKLKNSIPENDNYIWASNERENLVYKLNNNISITATEWSSFHSQLLLLLKEVNKRPKLNVWQELSEHLTFLPSLSEMILQDKELTKELQMAHEYLHENLEFSFLLPGLEIQLKEFLRCLKKPERSVKNRVARENENVVKITPLPIKKSVKKPSTRIMPDNMIEWFVDPVKGDLFNPRTIDRNIIIKPQKIRLKEFLSAIGSVAEEIIVSQSAFQRPLENLIRAFKVDFSEFPQGHISEIDDKCVEIVESGQGIDTDDTTDHETSTSICRRPQVHEMPLPLPKNGRETAIYMIKSYHLRQMRLAYLNHDDLRIKDPYSLHVVRQCQVHLEHYVFSSFGIIYQSEDGTGTAMSLTDWYRESVLYYALKCIPFVKNFLVKKYFQGWRFLTVQRRNISVGKYLTKNLITANVTLGKAILQILKLLDEISQVTFIPTQFTETQTEASFIKSISILSGTTDVLLEKFYRYIKLMANETAAELYKYLQFTQAQLHNDYLYSNDSIYLKKIKKENRQQALNDALHQVYKLGSFIRLINYMLNSKVVEITLNNIVILGELMCSLENNDPNRQSNIEAIFHTKIIITTLNDTMTLTTSPNVDEIETMFKDIINRIPRLILRHCYPLDGLLHTEYLHRYERIVTNNRAINRAHHVSIISSKSEAKTVIMEQSEDGEDSILAPEPPYIELPKKSEDVLRVATPPKVNPNVLNNPSMKVIGQAIPTKFTPLQSEDVFDILETNPLYQNLMIGFKDLFGICKEEISSLCSEYKWFIDVRREYVEWSDVDMDKEWVDQSPYMFEQRLIKVKNYIQTLDSTERKISLSNKIFVVHLDTIVEELLTEMDEELSTITDFILRQVQKLGSDFIQEISIILDVLRSRSCEAEIFSKVINCISVCREKTSTLQKSVDYIKSLFDVLRMTGKPLCEAYRSLEEEVTTLWESFIFQLQEANDFVNNEKQNVLFNIKSKIQELEQAARRIQVDVTTDRFSDLSDDTSGVLVDVATMEENISQIKSDLNTLFVCFHNLTNEDLTVETNVDGIELLVKKIRANWSLLDRVQKQLDEWKSSLFSRFNVVAASNQILEWQHQISQFLTDTDSRKNIVQKIEEIVCEFGSFMPFFHQLSSALFSQSHWQQFFLEIGHPFIDPYNTLTVQQLIDLDIRTFGRILDTLYDDAMMKNKANKDFYNHLRFWLTREFHFVQHVTDLSCKKVQERQFEITAKQKTPLENQIRSNLEIFHDNKIMENKLEKLSRLPITNNEGKEIFLVFEFNKLNDDVSDTIISIQSRRNQQNYDERYALLINALEGLRWIMNIFQDCQERWLFLERVFEEEFFVQAHLESAAKFAIVNKEFLSILDQLRQFPIALHHVPLGQILLTETNFPKSFLKRKLKELIKMMDEIVADVDKILSNARNLFPRLYFLPDFEMIKLLGCEISQDIRNIIPFVHFCFPSIENVLFSEGLPPQNHIIASTIIGTTGEKLDFFQPLHSRNVPSQWLKEFDLILKSTVKFYIESCVTQQITDINMSTVDISPFITDGTKSTIFIEIDQIEEIAHRISEEQHEKMQELVNNILLTYETWMMKYPLQVLLVTEKIHFTKQLKDALVNEPHTLVQLKAHLLMKKKNFVNLLNKFINKDVLKKDRIKSVVQNLLLLNGYHIDILENLEKTEGPSVNSFIYKGVIKYHMEDEENKISSSSTQHHYENIRVECLNSQFLYDYEYISIKRCDLTIGSITEQAIVNTLLGLNNYEVGTMIADSESRRETIESISEILGRNLFIVPVVTNINHTVFEKYILGALMSGSLLYLDKIDDLPVSVLSSFSRDLWRLRSKFLQKSIWNQSPKMMRRSSSPGKLFKVNLDSVLNVEKDWIPDSSRRSRPRTQYEMGHINYYELQNSKLNKGTNESCVATEIGNMNSENSQPYAPNFMFKINLYHNQIDVRYGCGFCTGLSSPQNLTIIPATLRGQMRIHSLVELDRKYFTKTCLIMAGQEDDSEELEHCIQSFIDNVNQLQPHLSTAIKKIIPLVISKTDWGNTSPMYALKKSFKTILLPKIINTFKDHDITKMIIEHAFPNCMIEDNVTVDSGFLHELKSQIRLRNRDIISSDIDKLLELKACIEGHQVIIMTGPPFSGKTSSIDILAHAINNCCGTCQTPRLDQKNRGSIDVLKSLSDERKSFSNIENCLIKDFLKRVSLHKITLANFTSEESNHQTIINGCAKPGPLSSVIDTIISKVSGKFQIWLCIETDLEHLEQYVMTLSRYLNESIKLIVEVPEPKQDNVIEISPSFGMVQFVPLQNIKNVILEEDIKSLLTRNLLTYYGTKYLQGIGKEIFQKLFDSISVPMEILKNHELEINCIVQTLNVLELILLENRTTSTAQESLTDLEKQLRTFLSFSIIQGFRGTIYSAVIERRLFNHEELEKLIKCTLEPYWELSVDNDEESWLSVFSLMIDFNTMSLKPFHHIKGNKLPPFWSCADGVAEYTIQLLIKHNRSVFLRGPRERVEMFLPLIRYNKRFHINNDLSVPILRKLLYDKKDKYWSILSNEDLLYTKPSDKEIILIENFSSDSRVSDKAKSFLQFCLENSFFFDNNLEESHFNRITLENFTIIFTEDNETLSSNYTQLKLNRWLHVINIMDPYFQEARLVLFRAVHPWIRKTAFQKSDSSKLLSAKVANFIIDIGTSFENYQRCKLISAVSDKGSDVHSVSLLQQSWSRTIQITKSLMFLPLDLFVKTFQNFEKTFPIETNTDSSEKNEILKSYKKHKIKIRIIRYIVFVISRFFIDPLRNVDDKNQSISIINQCLDINFFQDLSFGVDEMLLKHFPFSVERITGVIMLPGRICTEIDQDPTAYYQPIVEAHSWNLLQIARDHLISIEAIKAYLNKNAQLKCVVKSDSFFRNLMKMYKHVCQYSLKNSALLVEYSSSLVNGTDWAYFLSGLIQAKCVSIETSSEKSLSNLILGLKSAMIEAGEEQQKVLFHLNSSLFHFNKDVCEVLMKVLQQDSIVPLLLFLKSPLLRETTFKDHGRIIIQSDSDKQVRLSKVFLENIKRNFKVLITINKRDMLLNTNTKAIADWFLKSSLEYIVLEDHDIQMYRDSLDPILPILTRSHSLVYQLVADAHKYCDKRFPQFIKTFGVPFFVDGAHLQLSMQLYEFLFKLLGDRKHNRLTHLESALKSVRNSEKEIVKLISQNEILQKELNGVNEEINVSVIQVKNMKESYGLALSQCRSQEKIIADLTKPLKELKEKSKSNLDDVSPTYMAALETIRNLDPGAIEEIKTYIKPPYEVRNLVEIVFYLLGYEARWEEIKEIMVKINVYEELLYFDKDHLNDKKYKYLLDKLTDPSLHPDNLINISLAASSLSGWLFAVFKYSSLNRDINPQLGQLLSCQDRLNIAQMELGKMKVRTDIMKQDLDAKLEEQKDLYSRKKSLSNKIRNLKYRIESGKNLLSDLKPYFESWVNENETLRQEIDKLPLEIVFFIIQNVYLGRFPLSIRAIIYDDFRTGINQTDAVNGDCEIFEEQELRGLVDTQQWHSSTKACIKTARQISSTIMCPQIAFPGLGSMIMIHNCCEESTTILKGILESQTFLNNHDEYFDKEGFSSINILQFLDCSDIGKEVFDEKLKSFMKLSAVLVVKRVELLEEPSEYLRYLLFGEEDKISSEIHQGFRLLLLTGEMYCPTDTIHGLFSSTRLIHYDFSLGFNDVQECVLMTVVETCQPRLFYNLLEHEKQIFEIQVLSQQEKNKILRACAECNCEMEIRAEQKFLSLFDIKNFHSQILETDGKLFANDESHHTMRKIYSNFKQCTEKFSKVHDDIGLLLRCFGLFAFDDIVDAKTDEVVLKKRKVINLKQILMILKSQMESEIRSVTVNETVDAEISDEFIQKLQGSLLSFLVISLDTKMNSDEFMNFLIEYCIGIIANEQKDMECLVEGDINFIKTALLCKDPKQLLVENSEDSLEYISNLIDEKITKEVLHFSLLVETNIASLKGLTKSLIDNANLWKEYFQFPFSSSHRMPGFGIANQPEMLQKSIVWRLLNPNAIDDVYSSLVSYVFRENLLNHTMMRNEAMRETILNSSPVTPIVISTQAGMFDCSNTPLEVIDNCLRSCGRPSQTVILDCSSQSEMVGLFAQADSNEELDQEITIHKLVKQPIWLVLINVHLYSSENSSNQRGSHIFFHEIFKKIYKYFKNQQLTEFHPEFKLFVTLENFPNQHYPEILLDSAVLFHCRPIFDLDTTLSDQTFSRGNPNLESRLIKRFISGIFSHSLFKTVTARTNQDLKTIISLSALCYNDHSYILPTINLIYRNKIVKEKERKIFNKILLDISPLIDKFFTQNVSEVEILRTVMASLNTHPFGETLSHSTIITKKSLNDQVLFDQRSLDIIKSRVISMITSLRLIMNSSSSVSASNYNEYAKKLSCQILQMLLNLPIWSIRSISNIRFDLRLSWSDIESLLDQYYICNDNLPRTWPRFDRIESVSSWLEFLESVINKITTYQNESHLSLETWQNEISDLIFIR